MHDVEEKLRDIARVFVSEVISIGDWVRRLYYSRVFENPFLMIYTTASYLLPKSSIPPIKIEFVFTLFTLLCIGLRTKNLFTMGKSIVAIVASNGVQIFSFIGQDNMRAKSTTVW